jgi:hypothetical protein
MGNPMHKELYDYYLTTPAWRRRRDAAVERDGGRCQNCGADDDLQVHHISYGNVFDEQPEDLVTLCIRCHKREHSLCGHRECDGQAMDGTEACPEHAISRLIALESFIRDGDLVWSSTLK